MVDRIRATCIGPVTKADIRFGDVTVFVGPQATGKSVFLQLLKLIIDKATIHSTLRRFGIPKSSSAGDFFDLFFGEGMASIWSKEKSSIVLGNSRNETDLETYARARATKSSEQLFYIPAQRVLCLRDGITHPFTDYRAGDPFVLRDFSEKLHGIVQNEVGLNSPVFPRRQRIAAALRAPLEKHIFGGFGLRTDASTRQGRLVLNSEDGNPLPYLVWSAGQREFVPLLLGLYWLLPPSRVPKRNELEWVVIEEPEMGLHPAGIAAVFNLVMELRLRGYRVCISTHSPHVLDMVWAMRFIQESSEDIEDVLKLLDLRSGMKTRSLASAALGSQFRTYYFRREGVVDDISKLDPGSEDPSEGGWGGLTEFTGKAGNIVAEIANRMQVQDS